MRFTRVLWLTVAVFSAPGLLCAQQDALRGPAPTSRTHLTTNNAGEKTETHAQPQTAKVSSEMQALRQALDVQQQQIQQLREELQKRDETLQQMQQQLGTLQSVVLQTQRAAQ